MMGAKGTRLDGSPSQDAGSTPAASKFCRDCKKELPITDFYTMGKRNGKQRYKPTCKSCEVKETRTRYWDIIEEHFGGWRCNRCGFWGHPFQMDCHHINPADKAYEIAKLRGKAPLKLKEELKKCELLCANCHRIADIT